MSKCKQIIITFISGVVLIGCDNGKGNAGSEKQFADEIVNSMIPVKGGRFQMGDFGPLVGEKLPFSPDQNNKPLHWVELTTFRIAKNRVTWEEFNKWLQLANRGKNDYYKWATKDDMSERFKKPTGDKYPAIANWKDAFDFCHWVGNVTGKKSPYLLRPSGNMLHVVAENSDNLLTVIMSMT